MTMMSTEPQDPGFKANARQSFALQTAMTTLGASLRSVTPGAAEIRMPYNARFSQQHGYQHAGIITTIVDTACGYAALTLAPAGSNVLTLEFKINFMAPAQGEEFSAVGRVIKAGKTLTICQGEVVAHRQGSLTVVAIMQATMVILRTGELTSQPSISSRREERATAKPDPQ